MDRKKLCELLKVGAHVAEDEAKSAFTALVANGAFTEKRGTWLKMYRQYQCSCCGAVIDERDDNGLYRMIEFGERRPYCYWCGSFNDFERR